MKKKYAPDDIDEKAIDALIDKCAGLATTEVISHASFVQLYLLVDIRDELRKLIFLQEHPLRAVDQGHIPRVGAGCPGGSGLFQDCPYCNPTGPLPLCYPACSRTFLNVVDKKGVLLPEPEQWEFKHDPRCKHYIPPIVTGAPTA